MYSQETVFVEKTITTLFPGGGGRLKEKICLLYSHLPKGRDCVHMRNICQSHFAQS